MKHIWKSMLLTAFLLVAVAGWQQGSIPHATHAHGDSENESARGSITICKLIVDENGTVNDGSLKTGTSFAVHVKEMGIENTLRYKVSFKTQLSLNSDVLHHDGVNDA